MNKQRIIGDKRPNLNDIEIKWSANIQWKHEEVFSSLEFLYVNVYWFFLTFFLNISIFL